MYQEEIQVGAPLTTRPAPPGPAQEWLSLLLSGGCSPNPILSRGKAWWGDMEPKVRTTTGGVRTQVWGWCRLRAQP